MNIHRTRDSGHEQYQRKSGCKIHHKIGIDVESCDLSALIHPTHSVKASTPARPCLRLLCNHLRGQIVQNATND